MDLKKIDVKKTRLLKIVKKKTSKMVQRIDKLEHLVDRQEQYSRCNCLLVHGIAEKTMKIRTILSLK